MSSKDEDTPVVDPTMAIDDMGGQNLRLPWGQLHSTVTYINSFNLVDTEFKFGRDIKCDVVVNSSNLTHNTVIGVSKIHFIITKEIDGLVYIEDFSRNGTYINGNLVGKGKKNILQDNDEIAIVTRNIKIYIFRNVQNEESRYLPQILQKKYALSKLLGRGACGEVRLLYDRSTYDSYAVKKIIKTTPSQVHKINHYSKIETEINILKSLSHPCVIGVQEIVETDKEVFIILEYMKGGELSDRILSIKKLSESLVKFYFYQILLAVKYLHGQGITHRDLKPENVLLATEDDETLLKISDFGLSKIIDEETAMKTICGTPCYVAPEMLDHHNYKTYTHQVDVWSMGVILFYMLSGELPFRGNDLTGLMKMIVKGQFSMTGTNWNSVSVEAKDLIEKMLTVNPYLRIKIDQIMQHRWIRKDKNMIRRVNSTLERNKELILDSSGESPPAKIFCNRNICTG